MARTGVTTYIAALLGLALFAGPAASVTVENTQWETSGKARAVVKGIGKAKTDASLLLTFFAGGDARAVDAFEREFNGTYVVTGKKQNKAELLLDAVSTTRLEAVIASDIEAAVLRKAGQAVEVSVDIGTVTAKAHFNKKGTKVKFKLKAKAFGRSDVDPRARKTTYTVSTKGGSSL